MKKESNQNQDDYCRFKESEPNQPEKEEQMEHSPEEKKIEDFLGDAIRIFVKEKTEENSKKLLKALTDACVKNVIAAVSASFKDLKPHYAIYRMDETHYAYVAYTVSGNPPGHNGDIILFMPLRSVFEYTINDTDAVGIFIDVSGTEFDGARIFLPSIFLENVIRYADTVR